MEKEKYKLIIPIVGIAFLLFLSGITQNLRKRNQASVDDYIQRSEAMAHFSESEFGTKYIRCVSDVQGEITSNGYNNPVLSFSVSIPDSWVILSEEEMLDYMQSIDSNRWTFESFTNHINDKENNNYWYASNDGEVYLSSVSQYYDFISRNDDNQYISVLFLYDPNYHELNDYLITSFIWSAEHEVDNNRNIAEASHDSALPSEINGNSVYLVNWTITRSDGSVYYRTDIIDYVDTFVRVISIDYDEQSEFDEFVSGISYNTSNE